MSPRGDVWAEDSVKWKSEPWKYLQEEETASTKASGQKRAGLLKGKQGSADVADRQKSRMVGARHIGLRKGFQF